MYGIILVIEAWLYGVIEGVLRDFTAMVRLGLEYVGALVCPVTGL